MRRRQSVLRSLSLLLIFLLSIAISMTVLPGSQALGAQKQAPALGTLSTRVVDQTGNPLGALVVVRGAHNRAGQTDGYGYYKVAVPPGKYLVNAVYGGYSTQARRVTIASNRSRKVTIALAVSATPTSPASRGASAPAVVPAPQSSDGTGSTSGGSAPSDSAAPGATPTPAPAPMTAAPAPGPSGEPAPSTTGPASGSNSSPSQSTVVGGSAEATAGTLTIQALTAEPTITQPGGTIRITADVVNSEVDRLVYNWQASGGSITATGSQAVWVAPQATGEFTVSLVVSGIFRGRTASGSITIQVQTNSPAPPPPPPPPPTGTRDPALWPFDKLSPWNYPIGSGAIYEPIRSAIRGGGFTTGAINTESYTVAIWVASASDPIRKIYRKDRSMAYFERRVPTAATPSKGTDAHMIVISPDHLTAFEMIGAVKRADGDWEVSGAAVDVDLKAMGIRLPGGSGLTDGFVIAYGGSATAGVIRAGELGTGIKHALHFMTDPKMWNRNAPGGRPYVWPASSADGYATQPEPGGYGSTGNLYMGSLVAIPPLVNISALGLETPEGLVLARALQDYGAYGTDSAGVGEKIVFRFDYAAVRAGDINNLLSNWTPFQRDLDRIARQLQVLVNSHTAGNQPPVPGGGGTPRTSLAPDFATAQGALLHTAAAASLVSRRGSSRRRRPSVRARSH